MREDDLAANRALGQRNLGERLAEYALQPRFKSDFESAFEFLLNRKSELASDEQDMVDLLHALAIASNSRPRRVKRLEFEMGSAHFSAIRCHQPKGQRHLSRNLLPCKRCAKMAFIRSKHNGFQTIGQIPCHHPYADHQQHDVSV